MICAGSDGQNAARQIERIATGWRLKPIASPTIICTHAQSTAEILAPKHIGMPERDLCKELGAAMATGLEWVSFDILITRIALGKAVTKHEAHVFQHGLRQSLTLALIASEFGYLPLGCYSVFSRNCGGLSTIEPPVT